MIDIPHCLYQPWQAFEKTLLASLGINSGEGLLRTRSRLDKTSGLTLLGRSEAH